MNLLKAMATVAGLTGVSRVAGFVRDVLTAAILGAGPVADAFFVALKLPNFFRRVTAEGAFSVSFVPVYSGALEVEGQKPAQDFAMNVFALMALWLGAATILMMWAMPFVIHGVAPGFEAGGERYQLAVELSRITFPYLLLMSLTALLGGVLNAHSKFAPFAAAPVLFNLALIAALLLNEQFQSAGHAMAYGVLIAGGLQLVFLMLCTARYGLPLKIMRPKLDDKAKEVLKLMGPGVIGAGVMHINLFADLIIASFLETGSISYLYYADRLNQLPLGVVGIAVGTALLPMLSRAIAAEKTDEANGLYNRALEYCFLLALPAAAALAVIPDVIIQVLFERGAFGAEDTAVTAQVLMAYALGLPAYIAVKVFSTVHWARKDTVTPVKISVVATILNIVLSLALIWPLGVVGIALATGLTGWLQCAAHLWVLRGRDVTIFDDRLKRIAPRVVLSVAVMAGGLWLAQMYFQAGDISVLLLGAFIAGGIALYAMSLFALRAMRLSELRAYISR